MYTKINKNLLRVFDIPFFSHHVDILFFFISVSLSLYLFMYLLIHVQYMYVDIYVCNVKFFFKL